MYTGLRGSGDVHFKEPGAVGNLVFEVKIGVVEGTVVPHAPDDFDPALTQCA